MDSVELFEKMNSTLEKMNVRLENLEKALPRQPEPEPEPIPILCVRSQEYKLLSDLMEGMGLEPYYNRVYKQIGIIFPGEKPFVALAKIVGVNVQKFYRYNTPRIISLKGAILVYMAFSKNAEKEDVDASCAMIKKLISYCFESKHWKWVFKNIQVISE